MTTAKFTECLGQS